MKLLRSFPALCFALVLLGIAGLCAAQRSVGLLLFAGTLAAMSWYITEGPRGRILPRWVSNLLVIAASLYVFVDLFQNREDVLGVLGRFAIWLTLIKLYERRTARDHSHLLVLSLLLMITGCMQSTDLIFGVVLLVYVALGLYVLLLYQLYAAYERARDERQAAIPAGYRLIPPFKPVLGRHAGLHFRTFAAGLGIMGLLLSAFFFVSFPREIGADLLGTLRPQVGGRPSVFSWSVSLTTGTRITGSRARVCTVQVVDPSGAPTRALEPLLLRGAVLDRYDGDGQWSTVPTGVRQLGSPSAGSVPVTSPPAMPGVTYTQRLSFARPSAGGMPLPSVYAPIAVETSGRIELLYDSRRQTIRTADDARRLLTFSVKAQPQPSDVTLQHLTELAEPLPRSAGAFRDDEAGTVRALAERALAGAGVEVPAPRRRRGYSNDWQANRLAAAALMDYLQSGEFTYTLDLSDVAYSRADLDPIIGFLTESKRGHCEYFASALAALCQVVNVPARLVVGYIAYDYDEATSQYLVLESNAHAWVEVATGPHRWEAFDPSPPADVRQLSDVEPTLAEAMRSVYQRFEGDWSSNVIAFDESSQNRLMTILSEGWGRRLSATLEAARDWMQRVNQFFNVGPGGYIWMGLVAFALVLAVITLVKLMRRSLAIRRTLKLQHLRGGEYQRLLRQLGFYLDMLHALKRSGRAKPMWQPPLQFAAAGGPLAAERPRAAELVRELTGIFYQARYGGARLTRDDVARARALLDELAGALRAKH